MNKYAALLCVILFNCFVGVVYCEVIFPYFGDTPKTFHEVFDALYFQSLGIFIGWICWRN